MPPRRLLVFATFLLLASPVRAGLHYSGEQYAELPAQWRGFLLDQKSLRSIAVAPSPGNPASTLRTRYLNETAKLEKFAKTRALNPDELADLGALYVRLGQPAKTVNLLRPAQRKHPNHFAIAANLGAAFHLQADYDQAILALREAVRLAPGKWQKAEELHLKLVQARRTDKGDGLDNLFNVRFVDERGGYTPGKLAMEEKSKLPAAAVGLTQQLALWLPADGRVLWQLAELANVLGDVPTAAAMMDGCVTQFGMGNADLKKHRQVTRAAADQLAKAGHEGHQGLAARARRALLTRLDASTLPPISATQTNGLPWELVGETSLDKKGAPTFAPYLKDLNDKLVSLVGYMQPLGEDTQFAAFMLVENPIGCWYCEQPEVTAIVFVQLPEEKSVSFTRQLVRVVGRLTLNATDREDFLYTIQGARVAELD